MLPFTLMPVRPLCAKSPVNIASVAHFEFLNYGFGKLLGKLVSHAKVRSYKLFLLRVYGITKGDVGENVGVLSLCWVDRNG